MFITSNHYRIKYLSNVLQLEPCSDMFKVISDIMATWYEMMITIIMIIAGMQRKEIVHSCLL